MTETTQFHTLLLRLHVADPATFPASNNSCFPSENSSFIHLLGKKIHISEFLWFDSNKILS